MPDVLTAVDAIARPLRDDVSRWRVDLPLIVPAKRARAIGRDIATLKRHLALLEFQVTLHALQRHWPPGLLTLTASVHSDPALGRLCLHFDFEGPTHEVAAADRFRVAMDKVCEGTDAHWETLVEKAFEGGQKQVAKVEVPGLLWAAVRDDPAATARLKAAGLSESLPRANAPGVRTRL